MGLSELEKKELDLLTQHLLDHSDEIQERLAVIHTDMKLVSDRLRTLVYLAIALLASRTPELFAELVKLIGGH